MKLLSLRSAIAAASLLLTAGAFAAEDNDLVLGTVFQGVRPAGAGPWVNARFRDFSDAAPGSYGTYEWIRNTVELQVSAGSALYDDAGGSCCPVQGRGNLTSKEYLSALYLSFNERLNIKKLKLYWTGTAIPGAPAGANTFPAAGLEPAEIGVGKNAFGAGQAGSFDIMIEWPDNMLGPEHMPYSKLIFVYDDGKQDISPADFVVASRISRRASVWDQGDPDRPAERGAPSKSPYAPFVGVAHIRNIEETKDGWIKQ